MEWQGVLGWLMAIGGACLWLWEAYKVVSRQRMENEKMKELLTEATSAIRSLYQAHENALRFYREIVMTLMRGTMAQKKSEYIIKASGKQYSDNDPIKVIRAAQADGVNGDLHLKGFFTAPRRIKKMRDSE